MSKQKTWGNAPKRGREKARLLAYSKGRSLGFERYPQRCDSSHEKRPPSKETWEQRGASTGKLKEKGNAIFSAASQRKEKNWEEGRRKREYRLESPGSREKSPFRGNNNWSLRLSRGATSSRRRKRRVS